MNDSVKSSFYLFDLSYFFILCEMVRCEIMLKEFLYYKLVLIIILVCVYISH